nr:flavin reductase family protein [uncultured Halomonas sp.]
MSQSSFDTRAFRSALGTFTTGVTIITAQAENGTPVGITANSFNSVSMDPPLVLWSLAKNAQSLPVFNSTDHWNVHVLSTEQEALSGRFASRGEDKFAEIVLDEGVTPAPLLHDCTARFQCRTVFTHDGGDHLIFIGEVLAFDQSELPPLVFQSGQYAFTARKPRETPRLTAGTPAPECGYTEDLVGYLLGRAHFQMLYQLRQQQGKTFKDKLFYILSVLIVRDNQTLQELNGFIGYTGDPVTQEDLNTLEAEGCIVSEVEGGVTRYRLTGEGRDISLHQIAAAKAVEEDLLAKLGPGDTLALKLLLKRLINDSDPGLPDLWSTPETIGDTQ